MPNITLDKHSFLIDGRRLWLVSGAIHYPRVPRELWRSRIRAAKQAGLNCIETYVFWNAHEPAPGKFDFEGDLDLRHFVELIGQEGMWCILRPGPFVCAEWDQGGLPPWLRAVNHERKGDPVEVKLRQGDPRFLEACSRYLAAVMAQVADLQATRPAAGDGRPAMHPAPTPGDPAGGFGGGAGGPILLTQVENEWFSHHPAQHDAYLVELRRYLRENGCDTPLNNCNNLWQRIDGTIDTWNGAAHLAADTRQLAAVQPDAPRLVTEFWPGWFDAWGQPHDTRDTQLTLYRLASILATGAMPNLYMFFGGSNFGFFGGRTVGSDATFMTQSYDYDAPLNEHGGATPKLRALRPLMTFASHFGSIFATADPAFQPTAVSPTEGRHPVSVTEVRGSQGSATFLLQDERPQAGTVELLLPDGRSLPVPLMKRRAQWVVRDANLGGVATLDYTNLSPMAFVGRRLLVLFGPAGAEGLVSIDGTPLAVSVPTGKKPAVATVGELVVVVLNEALAEHALPGGPGLYVGVDRLDDSGKPVAAAGHARCVAVDLDGGITESRQAAPKPPAAPRLDAWQHATLPGLIDGTDEAYQPIDGPQTLERLGTPFGYGWYRVPLSGHDPALPLLAPDAGDRLHVYSDGRFVATLGKGPGADDEPRALKLGDDAVVLADNLGRFNYGQYVGKDTKGLASHLYHVSPVKLPKLEVTPAIAPDPFELDGYVAQRRFGDRPPADRVSFTIKATGRKPMILDVRAFPQDAVLLINDQPVALVAHADAGLASLRLPLTPGNEPFSSGTNTVTLALYDHLDPKAKPANHIRLFRCETSVTSKGQWKFAKWTVPAHDQFAPMPKATPALPAWYRTTFDLATAPTTDTPLYADLRGLSKGQAYLNGHNLGRYFVATATGKAVPPQSLIYLPEPWLHTDRPNTLTLFDEHGKLPTKVKLGYRTAGPYG
ncbi:MAG: beta-galactosidase [Planctomycetota bacterium]